ncbi:MAG: hypothetical protein R3A51_06865 [Nannocystaceae bacterium]|nr:hypothetical protein [Myxococcales bacterium]
MRHRIPRISMVLATGFLLAFILGFNAGPASASAGDCIHATCSGITSCKKLKRGCDLVSDSFTATRSDSDGTVRGGVCNACF